jgi:hypothetical protein
MRIIAKQVVFNGVHSSVAVFSIHARVSEDAKEAEEEVFLLCTDKSPRSRFAHAINLAIEPTRPVAEMAANSANIAAQRELESGSDLEMVLGFSRAIQSVIQFVAAPRDALCG